MIPKTISKIFVLVFLFSVVLPAVSAAEWDIESPDVTGFEKIKNEFIQGGNDEHSTKSIWYRDKENSSNTVSVNVMYSKGNSKSEITPFSEGSAPIVVNGVEIFGKEEVSTHTKLVFWQSNKVVNDITVLITYFYERPDSIIIKMLEILPKQEPIVEVPELSSAEKENLLYTSPVFENYPDYATVIIRSYYSSAPCDASKSDAEIEGLINQFLSQRRQKVDSSAIKEMLSECKLTHSITLPSEPLPYDISSCFLQLEHALHEQKISYYAIDIEQECLIRAYSEEKFVQNGGKKSDFDALVEEREPLVIELLQSRNNRQSCAESEEDAFGKCPVTVNTVQKVNLEDEVFSEDSVNRKISRTVEDGVLQKNMEISKEMGDLIIQVSGIKVKSDSFITLKDKGVFVAEKKISFFPDELPALTDVLYDADQTRLKVKDGKPVYETNGVQKANLFFVIPVDVPTSILISAESGERTIVRPWWAFLAQ